MDTVFIAKYVVQYEGENIMGVGSTFEKAAAFCDHIPYQDAGTFVPEWNHVRGEYWESQFAGFGQYEIHEWKVDE